MQREVTLLNESNKFVTVKWLARIAFHVDNAVERVQLWVEFGTHYIEVGCPSSTGVLVSRKHVRNM